MIQFSINPFFTCSKMKNLFNLTMNATLTSTTNLDQIEPGNNDNEGVLNIPKTRTSLLEVV